MLVLVASVIGVNLDTLLIGGDGVWLMIDVTERRLRPYFGALSLLRCYNLHLAVPIVRITSFRMWLGMFGNDLNILFTLNNLSCRLFRYFFITYRKVFISLLFILLNE